MFRCKCNHPTYQKLEKLMAYAQELGISISFYGLQTIVQDRDYPNREYYFRDIEDCFSTIMDIPYHLEYELLYEKEEDSDA